MLTFLRLFIHGLFFGDNSSNTAKDTIPKIKKTKKIFPEKEVCGHSPNSTFMCPWAIYIYIPMIDLPILLQENMWTDPGNIAHRHMTVEIRTETAQFPEKENINGIFDAVYCICNIFF